MSIGESNTWREGTRRAKSKGKGANRKGTQGGRSGWKIGPADRFCICKKAGGSAPVVLIEYKSPHKLPLATIIAGLKGEIGPAEEIIHRQGNDFEFLSKYLVAAVITQLFASMIGKGVQRGYIFTGEAIIFLFIPDDPTIVYYHLSIPCLDFREDDQNKLHRTSIAQISAFVLTALAAEAPGLSWHDAATEGLVPWDVEYIDILKEIPETARKARKAPSDDFSYEPEIWEGFLQSPIRTPIRTRFRSTALASRLPNDQICKKSSEGDDDDVPPTLPPRQTAQKGVKQRKSVATERRGAKSGPSESSTREQNRTDSTRTLRIDDRPYCSQKCLLGLVFGLKVDDQCPNFRDHKAKHIKLRSFLRLIRIQLAEDRGPDADSKPLYLKGSRGALFKIRLSSHGYTLVGKAMKRADCEHLRQETKVYKQLQSIQGHCIPVCLGIVNLKIPYYYDYGVYETMLFLSGAGRAIRQYLKPENEAHMLDKMYKALEEVHKQHVLHRDVELRNWLWDEQRNIPMLVDFERAEIQTWLPLSSITPNRKRNEEGEMEFEVEENDFVREMRSARWWISQSIR